jgi:hypothetical protein
MQLLVLVPRVLQSSTTACVQAGRETSEKVALWRWTGGERITQNFHGTKLLGDGEAAHRSDSCVALGSLSLAISLHGTAQAVKLRHPFREGDGVVVLCVPALERRLMVVEQARVETVGLCAAVSGWPGQVRTGGLAGWAAGGTQGWLLSQGLCGRTTPIVDRSGCAGMPG